MLICVLKGVRVGWSVSEVRTAFVTTLAGTPVRLVGLWSPILCEISLCNGSQSIIRFLVVLLRRLS